MGSYSSLFCVFVTILLCFVSSVFSQPDFLFKFCGKDGNYINNSVYQENLNNVFTTINSNTQNDYWWYNISSGGSSDNANAMALCRGDVKEAECSSCLNDSTKKITQVCPYQKEAVGWYDNCMLWYSNSSIIFERRVLGEPFSMCNNIIPPNATRYNDALGELMANLSKIASSGDSRRKFATGEVRFNNFEKIFGLVQCTPDLNKRDCYNCITECIRLIPTGCGGNKMGGRVINRLCSVRFEKYEFFDPNFTVTAPSPSIYLPSLVETTDETNRTISKEIFVGTKNPNRSWTIIIVVNSVVASVVLIALICIYLRSKKPMESLRYDFSTIKLATNDFSDANKLG